MSEEEIKGITDENLNEEAVTADDNDAEASLNDAETEVFEEDANEGADYEYQPQFGELMNESNPDETDEETEPKKGSAKPVIITAAIVVLLAVIGVVLYFIAFAPTINGTWKVASENVENTYFTISDGKLIVETGNEYAHSYSEHDFDKVQGKNTFYLTVGNGGSVKYTYEADGNMFTGRNVTLVTENVYSGKEETKLESTSEKNIPDLKPVKDFKENKELTGSWSNEELGYTFTFDKRGILKQVSTQSGYTENKCIYSINDKKITIYQSKQATSEMDIKIDGNTLTLSSNGQDITFTRVKN